MTVNFLSKVQAEMLLKLIENKIKNIFHKGLKLLLRCHLEYDIYEYLLQVSI